MYLQYYKSGIIDNLFPFLLRPTDRHICILLLYNRKWYFTSFSSQRNGIYGKQISSRSSIIWIPLNNSIVTSDSYTIQSSTHYQRSFANTLQPTNQSYGYINRITKFFGIQRKPTHISAKLLSFSITPWTERKIKIMRHSKGH